jgi:protein Mpv17
MVAVLMKMGLDQTLMAPLMTMVFFAAMKALEGKPGEAVSEVQTKLQPTMMANWMVWPLAHVVNFALVPPAQRILYVNVVNVSGAWGKGAAGEGVESASMP